MENKKTIDQPEPIPPKPEEIYVSAELTRRKSTLTFVLFGIFVILLICASAFFVIKSMRKSTVAPQTTVIPQITVVPTQVTGETANWKTYSNEKYGFSVKYNPVINPEEFKVVDPQLVLVSFGLVKNNGFTIEVTKEYNFDNYKSKIVGHVTDRIDKEETIMVDGVSAKKLTYKAVLVVDEIDTSEVIISKNNIFYTIKALSIDIDQILSTFKFLDQTSKATLLEPKLVPTTNWKIVSFPQNVRISQGGDTRPANIEMKLVSNWSSQIVKTRNGKGIGGADCNDFNINNEDKSLSLIIKPVCGDTNNDYLPISGEIQKVELITNKGNDNSDGYIVRYFDETKGVYHYGEILVQPGVKIDTSKDEIYPNLILQYEPDRYEQWLWASVDLIYSGSESGTEIALNTADTIISTLKLID